MRTLWSCPPLYYGEDFDTETSEVGAGSLSFCWFSWFFVVLLGFAAGLPTPLALFDLPSFCDTFLIFNLGSGPEHGHETALVLVSGANFRCVLHLS